MKVFDKFTGREVGQVETIKIDDISMRRSSAENNYFNIRERLTILRKASDLIGENRDFLAQTLSMETGKAYKNAEREIMNAEDHLMNPILTLNTNDISKPNNFEKSKEVHLFNVPEGIPVQIFVDEAIRGIMPGQRTIVLHNPSCPLTTMKISEILSESVKDWQNFINDILVDNQINGIRKIISSGELDSITFHGTPEQSMAFSKLTGLLNVKMNVMTNYRAIIWDKKYMEYALDWAVQNSLTPVSNHRLRVQTIIVKAEFFTYFKNRFTDISKKLKFGIPVEKSQDCNYYPNITEEKRAIEVVKAARQNGFIIEGEEDKRFPIVLHNEYDDLQTNLEEADGAIAFIVPAKSLKDAVKFSFSNKPWDITYLFANGIEEADMTRSMAGRSTIIFNPKKEDIVGFQKHIEKKGSVS